MLSQYEERSGAGRRKTALKSIEVEEEERSRTDNNLAIEIARQLQGKHFLINLLICCLIFVDLNQIFKLMESMMSMKLPANDFN